MLKGTSLSEVNFTNVDISKVLFAVTSELFETYEENEKFAEYGVDLSFSNLSNKNMSNKNLDFTNLSYADFSNTDLSFASLQFANLEGANLEGANLKCINHEECIG